MTLDILHNQAHELASVDVKFKIEVAGLQISAYHSSECDQAHECVCGKQT